MWIRTLSAIATATLLSLPAAAQDKPKTASAALNYRNDCIKPLGMVKGTNLTVDGDQEYVVVNQAEGKSGTELRLARARSSWLFCQQEARDEAAAVVPLSALEDAGFQRTGFVYGALMLPYKFQLADKSFTNNVSVGPYLGKRSTIGSLSFTWAGTLALTQVTGTSLDADKKPVLDSSGNPQQVQLSALTIAGGLIFEIAKGDKGTSPFKAGLFYGQDRVSSSNAASYPYNKRPWFAIQLGYDFTDN